MSPALPKQKIELNRRFVPFSDGPTGLHVDAYLQLMQGLDRGLTWEELLVNRWIVVLGEAGTGKSTEFELRPLLVRRPGTQGFAMNITALAQDGPELAVRTEDTKLLEAWRNGNEQGVFFLDSLDEAELRQHSLQRALRKLAAYLGVERHAG